MGGLGLLLVAAATLAEGAAASACIVVEPPPGVPSNGTLRHTLVAAASASAGAAAEAVCWDLRCSGQLTLAWLRFSAPRRPVSLYAGGVLQWTLSGSALLPQPATYDDAVMIRVPAAAAAAAAGEAAAAASEELVADWACEPAPAPDCAETHRPAAPDSGEADAVVSYTRENVTTTGPVCWLLRCAAPASSPSLPPLSSVVSVRWTRFETESAVSLYTLDADADEADAAATRRWTRRGQELPPAGEYAGDAAAEDGAAPAVLVRMEGTGGSAVDREDVEFAWACGGPPAAASSPEPPTGVPVPPVDADRAALRVVVYEGTGCGGVAVASALLPAGLEDGVCAGVSLADGRRVRVAAAGCAGGGVRRLVACAEEGRRVWVETGAAGAAAACAALLGGGGGSAALSGACPADTAVLRIVLRSPWRVVRPEEFNAALRGAVASAMGGAAVGVTPARVGILGERGTATRLHVWLRAQGVRDAARATANLEASLASPDSYIQRLFGSTGVIAEKTEDAAALARTYGEEGTVPVVTVVVETRESVAAWSIVLVVLLGLALLCMVGGAAWVAVFAEDEEDEDEEEEEEEEYEEEEVAGDAEGPAGAEAASAAGCDDDAAAAKVLVEEDAACGDGVAEAEAEGALVGRSPLDTVSNALQIIQRSGRPTQPSLKYVESKSVEI